MTLAEQLERLARIVPGVAGYQDRERARDADKAVTAKQPSYSLIAGPRPELHGCYYDVEDAILLGRFVRAVDAAGAGFTVTRVTLTWFPFATDRHELIDPFSGLALPANPLL